MKRAILFFAMLCSALTLSAQDPYANSTLVKTGDKVPAFSVEMLDGNTVTSKQMEGKVVLINFWATWCPYCIYELNHIHNGGLSQQLKNPDFIFLPISRGETRAAVSALVKKRGYTFSVAIDPDEKVWNKFATRAIPRNFVVDKNGKVVFTGVGYSEQDFLLVKRAIDKALE